MKNNDLQARTYQYSLEIVRFIKDLPKNECAKVLGKQLLRSGTSVGANVIEAQAGSSRKDFINFYHHSLKSANESKFWLYLIRDSEITTGAKIDKILDETIQISKILGRSILTLKDKP